MRRRVLNSILDLTGNQRREARIGDIKPEIQIKTGKEETKT